MPASAAPLRKRRIAMLARTIRALARGPRLRAFPPLRADLLPQMRGRIEILRDANGIPHVYAEEEPDLYAALGYLQAADRFFSLDLVRHFGAGRLCELIGNLSLPKRTQVFSGKGVKDLDAFVRPLDFERQSHEDYGRVSERGRECLEAYAAGINAALKAMRGVFPLEYLLFGAVRRWDPADALLCAQTCAFTVQLSPLDVELAFDEVRGHLGNEACKRMYPEAPWDAVPATYKDVEGPEPEIPVHLAASGSNNWAVSGARSASGAPIFANDPHVPFFPLPTFWYHAHIECRLYRIQGGLMLGCPIFGFGQNGHLAWGVTTAYRDAWDLCRVRRAPDDPSRYRTANGAGRITHHSELHPVRFGKPVSLEWETCDHGILYPGWKHHDGTDLALRHASSDLARYFDGYLALAEAETPEQHREALAQINDGPFDFNHVYAHKDGHIAWEPFGRLPRRSGDGLFVRDADDPAAQWDGFHAFSENPKLVNPERGYVASANSIADAAQIPRSTTAVHVEPPHRQHRIEFFLAARHDHSVDSFKALQSDVGADYAPLLRDALVRHLDAVPPDSDLARRALPLLRAWDGAFNVDRAGASLYVFTMRALADRVLLAVLGEKAGRRFLATRRGVFRMQRLLLDSTDPLHADVESASGKTLTALVAESFTAATARLARRHGEDPTEWHWGRVQRIRLGTLFGEIPLIGRWFRALDAPFSGEHYTVSPSVSLPVRGAMRPFVGATSRFICDLGKPDEAWFAHTSGPSGDVGSAFFANLTQSWYRFEYFRSALWKPEEVPNVVERVVVGV
jgi:penicillin amidase